MKYSANIVKIFLICICIASQYVVNGQEDEDYTYSNATYTKNILAAGVDHFIPTGDFGRKLDLRSTGAKFSYYRQVQDSRYFIGMSVLTRKIGGFTIPNRFFDVNQTTKVSNLNVTAGLRVYPELSFLFFEFFFEGGIGINSIRGVTSLYDVIAETNYDHFTELSNRKLVFYGSAGFNIPITDITFITANYNVFYGPTIEFMSRRKELSNVFESYEAFDFKNAAYTANSISLSLSFLF